MKIILILFITVSMMFSKSDKLSSISPTNSVFINTDVELCGYECMDLLLENGHIFSFISNYNSSIDELSSMRSEFAYYKRLFRINENSNLSVKIAVLVPQKIIRRYASTTVNTILAYLLSKQNNFEVKVFNSYNEKTDSILREIEKIKNQNFKYVIAPVTAQGAEIIVNNVEDLSVYIPTVHKNAIFKENPKVVFGGIDYEKQIDELLKFSNDKIAYFSDGSVLSDSINTLIDGKSENIVYSKSLSNSRISFKRLFKDNKDLDQASIFLNTPLVKTSLISSQLRVYDIEPHVLLSTQINYNPMLLTLTQFQDRKELFLANSIGKTTVGLEELNSLFGHDIVYNWVNYSTTVGIDYFYSTFFVPEESRDFDETVEEFQVKYNVSIVKPLRHNFKRLK